MSIAETFAEARIAGEGINVEIRYENAQSQAELFQIAGAFDVFCFPVDPKDDAQQ